MTKQIFKNVVSIVVSCSIIQLFQHMYDAQYFLDATLFILNAARRVVPRPMNASDRVPQMRLGSLKY